MKYSEFQLLSEGHPKDPKIGDLFLDNNLIEQKSTKMREGDELIMYKIINVIKNDYGFNIEYITTYDKLEF